MKQMENLLAIMKREREEILKEKKKFMELFDVHSKEKRQVHSIIVKPNDNNYGHQSIV
jgi:ribulose bisphosphate carboxylase small subunit